MTTFVSSTSSTLQCVFCRRYLGSRASPRQGACGDRLCGTCLDSQIQGANEVQCPACGDQIVLAECFRDRAVEQEVASLTIPCTNKDCPWQGSYSYLEVHAAECKYALVSCSNKGCGKKMKRADLKQHCSYECAFEPALCQYCNQPISRGKLDVHQKAECPASVVPCPNKCGHKCQRKMLQRHVQKECLFQLQPCGFINCSFKGTVEQLKEHESKAAVQHIQCLETAFRKHLQESKTETSRLKAQLTEKESEIAQLKADMASKLQPLADTVKALEISVQQLQDGFTELALVVQTLQATSYNGSFTWKIPEIQRRRNEALIGKTISLYSAPFYAGRHGYKVCLRLYLNGDGSGKGTHLSFFITIMRGEYDALLPWPFKQTVTLLLLDQDKLKDVMQSFRPEPSSSSFQRPRSEMNVASGCPMFTPISVLTNRSYVKDDVMYMKCTVDCHGLEAFT